MQVEHALCGVFLSATFSYSHRRRADTLAIAVSLEQKPPAHRLMGFCRRCGDIVVGQRCGKCGGTSVGALASRVLISWST